MIDMVVADDHGLKGVFITGPRTVEIGRVQPSEPGPGHVLVRSIASGISAGTELNVYRGDAPQWRLRQDPRTRLFVPGGEPEWRYPMAYGYANVGKVERVGPGVDAVGRGQLVFTYAAHAAAVVVPESLVVPLPDLAAPELGVFVANLNTAYNGVLDARPPLGACVVVVGLGVIGQLAVRLLKRSGAGCVIAVDGAESRRLLARRSGADEIIDPASEAVAERVRALTMDRGADIVIEVSGAPAALGEAIRTVGYGGTVVVLSWYGGSFERLNLGGEFHHNRVRVVSSQVGAVDPALGPLWSVERRTKHVVELLSDLDLASLVSHRFRVEDAAEGYALVDAATEGVMQVILTYGDPS